MNIPSFVGAETVINYNQILFKVVQKSKEVFTWRLYIFDNPEKKFLGQFCRKLINITIWNVHCNWRDF